LGLIQTFNETNINNNVEEKNATKISYEKIDEDWEIFAPVVVARRYKEKKIFLKIFMLYPQKNTSYPRKVIDFVPTQYSLDEKSSTT